MIKIIDYGMGNCASIQNMLRYLGHESEIVSKGGNLTHSTAIILPGVGAFDHAMEKLKPFLPVLRENVLEKKVPFLGICLGMQLLFEKSEEGSMPGLGWIPGIVAKFNFSAVQTERKLPIPHMGWNEITHSIDSTLFKKSSNTNRERFYFVHSYHAVCEEKYVLAKAHYGYDFVCAVQNNNVFGVQFHPEKSHRFGKRLLADFLSHTHA